MTREEMMNEVIRCKGFENRWTIWFCELCESERFSDDTLEDIKEFVMIMPMMDTEEEE